MPREQVDIPLFQSTPGTSRVVRMVRYGGREARPKAYIHAALHADEAPGILVAHHLLRVLDEADARGEILGQIVVVPCANPIGLGQYVHGDQLGRYELASGRNFNRGWPDLSAPVAEQLDAGAGAEAIRRAMKAALDAQVAGSEDQSLRLALAREACDADLVLDLHCDDEGLMHLFVLPSLWPAAADLARELGCRAVLLSGDSGGATFAESMSLPWERLSYGRTDGSSPGRCLAATVELRGFSDVDDDLAASDAGAFLRVLQRRGLIGGDPGPLPEPVCDATPFEACDIPRAPMAGVLSYRAELGQHVQRGEAIADIVDPFAATPEAARQPVRAATEGFVLSRRSRKLVRSGEVVAKIVGRDPLPQRKGYLLED